MALVVVYHFWPERVTGGFVGVDVFFVISGFLITSHLLSRPPRDWAGLAGFWGRRIRRLLPASFLVLAATLAATLLIAPRTMWEATATQTAAAALYVENWLLAGQAVDYLAIDNVPTPVQHFWSLSIEEQFYLAWPVLILIAYWVASRLVRVRVKTLVVGLFGVIVGLSLAASVLYTAGDPAAAYFVTWTRVWELGVGGLAACVFVRVSRLLGDRDGLRSLLAYAGLAMVLASALLFDAATPFPGVAALIPVAGTALVLLAAVQRSPLSPLPVMALRPVQAIGDWSYSIYLVALAVRGRWCRWRSATP